MSAARVASDAPKAGEVIVRRALVGIRGGMGMMFVACGVRGLLDVGAAQNVNLQQGMMAFGGALMLAGALLPLLKGTEVLVELVLDVRSAGGSRRARDR